MFKKIYTPIDNSDVSDKVLIDAVNIAKGMNSKLRVVHVVNLEQITFGVEMVGVAELKGTLMQIANKLIDHIKNKLREQNFEAEVVLLENYGQGLASIIVEDAKKWDSDLFILGSHHLGSFSHFVTGGVAEDIAHDCEIPILLITQHK